MSSKSDFVTLKNIKAARVALETSGCLLIDQPYNRQACDEIIGWIDANVADKDEKNYGGTEHRIWDSQKRFVRLDEFTEQCNVFMSCLLQSDAEAYTLLAIRNRALAEGDQASQLGRWHIDSFRRQYKIFLFLGDVTESTGCFEFIPGTHATAFKARMALSGIYFGARDLFDRTRRYSRLPDGWVNRIGPNGYRPSPVLCHAGTVMIVDTSAIHRARPCLKGSRYALTAYYR